MGCFIALSLDNPSLRSHEDQSTGADHFTLQHEKSVSVFLSVVSHHGVSQWKETLHRHLMSLTETVLKQALTRQVNNKILKSIRPRGIGLEHFNAKWDTTQKICSDTSGLSNALSASSYRISTCVITKFYNILLLGWNKTTGLTKSTNDWKHIAVTYCIFAKYDMTKGSWILRRKVRVWLNQFSICRYLITSYIRQ